MWYIIAVEPASFAQTHITPGEVKCEYKGREEGVPIFEASEGIKIYSVEVFDNEYEPYYLQEFNELNPSGFIYITHTTFLLKWKEGEEKLKETLKKVIYRKDKFAVFRISEMVVSNFLPLDYLNSQIKTSEK